MFARFSPYRSIRGDVCPCRKLCQIQHDLDECGTPSGVVFNSYLNWNSTCPFFVLLSCVGSYSFKLLKNKYGQAKKGFVYLSFTLLCGGGFLNEFYNTTEVRGGNSPRFSIIKIFQFNPELGQTCSKITNKMFKRTKHP